MPSPLQLALKSEPDEFSPVPLLINCETYDAGSQAKFRYPVRSNHGLRDFATLTNGGGIRGMLQVENLLYVVSGQKLFSVGPSGSVSQIAGIPGNDRVYMEVNRRTDPQIMLVTNGLAYVLQNGTLSQYADPDLPAPISVLFLNGNFIFLIPDGRLYSSELESTDVDAADFATAEANRDGLLGGMIRGSDALYFGSETLEIWRPDGGTNFAQSRLSVDPQGCMSGKSIASHDGQVFWVNKFGVVSAMGKNTYATTRVSNKRIERDIENEASKQNMRGFSYVNRGVGYYVLSGTTFTWRLNLETGFWSRLESHGLNVWKGLYAARFNNQTIIGDHQSNRLYLVDNNYHKEGSDHLVWSVASQIIHSYPNQIEMNELFVDSYPGLGDGSTNEHNSDPKLTMQVSKDAGNSWSNERAKSVGQLGQRNKQIRFNRIGTSKEDGFAIRLSSSASVAGGISGLSAEMVKAAA